MNGNFAGLPYDKQNLTPGVSARSSHTRAALTETERDCLEFLAYGGASSDEMAKFVLDRRTTHQIAPCTDAYVPLSIRHGRRVARLLWRIGFSYETCRRFNR